MFLGDFSTWPQEDLGAAPGAPRGPQGRSKRAPEAPKSASRRAKTAPRGAKRAPRAVQEAPRGPKSGPHRAKIAPRGARSGPRLVQEAPRAGQERSNAENAARNHWSKGLRDRSRPRPQEHAGSLAGIGGASPTGDPANEPPGSTLAVERSELRR